MSERMGEEEFEAAKMSGDMKHIQDEAERARASESTLAADLAARDKAGYEREVEVELERSRLAAAYLAARRDAMAERNAALKLAEKRKAALEEREPFVVFWSKVRDHIFDADLDGGDAQEYARDAGLLVETKWNEAEHAHIEGEPGDTIYVETDAVAKIARAALAEGGA